MRLRKVGSLIKGFHHGWTDQQSREHIAVFVGLVCLDSHTSCKNDSKTLGLKSQNVWNTFFKSLGSSETNVKPTSSLQTVESMVVPVSALQKFG